MQTSLIMFVAKSASGKDTCANWLGKQLMRLDIPVHWVISCTTRPPREGEKQDKAYHFISKEDFLRHIKDDDFLEYDCFRGWYYGTLKYDIKEGCINIAVVNPEGVRSILWNQRKIPVTRYLIFYLVVPWYVRLRRSIKREGRFRWEFIRRMWTDYKDFKWFDDKVIDQAMWKYNVWRPIGAKDSKVKVIQKNVLPEDTIFDRILIDTLENLGKGE